MTECPQPNCPMCEGHPEDGVPATSVAVGARTYHCEMCHGDFETDEPAECHEGAGPGIPGAASICDDCFKKIEGAMNGNVQ